ncbi:MAG: glycosyltransferase [Bacilli bacterium]
MSYIVYTGVFDFPFGQAAAKRVLGNIKLLKNLGHEVVVGHGGEELFTQFHDDDIIIDCYGLDELFNKSSGFLKLFNFMFKSGDNTVKWLDQLHKKPDYIIVYGGYYRYAKNLLKYCNREKIKIIFDVVEWYEPSQMLGGRFGFFYNSFLLAFKFVYPKADGIIVISSSLKSVFSRNVKVVIPPLITSYNNTFHKPNETLSLIYAGNIGNKDKLHNIIKVVEKLSEKNSIEFNIFGPTEEELKAKFNIPFFNGCIKIYGKIPQKYINSYIEKSDFTIFTRPNTHTNKYGFPSKFVESLSLGVPVATNLTSDLSLYLQESYNGFVIDDESEHAIEACIVKMLNLTVSEKIKIKENALISARHNFSTDSSLLKHSVLDFFEKLG